MKQLNNIYIYIYIYNPNAPCGASTAAPYFVALRLLRLLSRRRMQYAVCELEISFSAGFLLVLWRFFASLASFLLVLCKFSASFLPVLFFRSFLQIRCMCSASCLVCGAFGEYQNLMQETVPGVIENHSKWDLKGPKFLGKSWQTWPGALQAASRAQANFRNANFRFDTKWEPK